MIRRVARGYGIELEDWERPSSGVLIASGSGMMLSIMDCCPCYRWCFDHDLFKNSRLDSFVEWADRLCDPVGFAGWFSISDPQPIIAALRKARSPIVYGGNMRLSVDREVESIQHFIEASNAAANTSSGTLNSPCIPR